MCLYKKCFCAFLIDNKYFTECIKVNQNVRIQGQYFIEAGHLRFMDTKYDKCDNAVHVQAEKHVIIQCVCEKLSFPIKTVQ
jgi:hypothetical protein